MFLSCSWFQRESCNLFSVPARRRRERFDQICKTAFSGACRQWSFSAALSCDRRRAGARGCLCFRPVAVDTALFISIIISSPGLQHGQRGIPSIYPRQHPIATCDRTVISAITRTVKSVYRLRSHLVEDGTGLAFRCRHTALATRQDDIPHRTLHGSCPVQHEAHGDAV